MWTYKCICANCALKKCLSVAGWPPWTHACIYHSQECNIYIRTDFEFDTQLWVCMCSVSLHYNASLLYVRVPCNLEGIIMVFLVRQCFDQQYSLYMYICTLWKMYFLDPYCPQMWINAVEQIVYCLWTQHASPYTLRYVRTDFEFYMQQPVCMCSVSLHYNVSMLQEFPAMQRVVSLARLLCNLGVEKQSGHMSQVTMAQGAWNDSIADSLACCMIY